MSHSLPPLPAPLESRLAAWPRAAPLAAIGDTIDERVLLGDAEFHMLRPAEPDRLLEHPAIVLAFAQDEYMPYWCDLWPASRMLAKTILQRQWDAGTPTLELGCGL